METTLLTPAGVTVAQYSVLLCLRREPRHLRGGPGPHRNVLETRLTDEGRAFLADADARVVRAEQALAARFTDEERAALVGLLGRCVDVLEKERARP